MVLRRRVVVPRVVVCRRGEGSRRKVGSMVSRLRARRVVLHSGGSSRSGLAHLGRPRVGVVAVSGF
jgi:hypothetical protein